MCIFGASGVHWAYWWLPLLSAFDGDSVIVDLLFICCLLMISLFVWILCFLHSSHWERGGCFAMAVFLLSCGCWIFWVSSSRCRGLVCIVCNCGISWSYSLTFSYFVHYTRVLTCQSQLQQTTNFATSFPIFEKLRYAGSLGRCLNTRPNCLVFKQLPRGPANVNAWKNMSDPYYNFDAMQERLGVLVIVFDKLGQRLTMRVQVQIDAIVCPIC